MPANRIRYDVVPAPSERQTKPYPVYQFIYGNNVLLEADKEACLFWAFGYMRGLHEYAEELKGAR